MEYLTFAGQFDKYFTVKQAISQQDKEDVYRMRHRVYCEEFQFETKEQDTDGMETDEYDEHAVHNLIIHRETNQPAASVRLIPAMETQLPFEKHGSNHLNCDQISELSPQRDRMCELSRLTVDANFRRRLKESESPSGLSNDEGFFSEERRLFPLIGVATYFSAIILGNLTQQSNIFAMMDPYLPRLLKYNGIHSERVGEDINYHGLRTPCYINGSAVYENIIGLELQSLYAVVAQMIASSMATPVIHNTKSDFLSSQIMAP
jgi:N-acyl amino acid synthase of PEP-CTERM/exosortase system